MMSPGCKPGYLNYKINTLNPGGVVPFFALNHQKDAVVLDRCRTSDARYFREGRQQTVPPLPGFER
jgi:hypothetical protein